MVKQHKKNTMRVITHMLGQCFYALIAWAFKRWAIPMLNRAFA